MDMSLPSSQPPRRFGCCHKFRLALIDTFLIYRVGATRAGTATAVCGVLSMILGGILMGLNKNEPWAGLGVWTGMPVFICGLICIAFRHKRPNSVLSPPTLLTVIGILASTVLLVTSIINLCVLASDRNHFYKHYTKDIFKDESPLVFLNVVLLVISPIEFLLTVWLFSISLGYVLPCVHLARKQIFTIQDDGLEGETDFTVEHFSIGGDRERILRMDTSKGPYTADVSRNHSR